MDKPLKDWTLGELQEYCSGRNCVANECGLCTGENGVQDCKVRGLPSRWDLSDPPRWTAEDIADAKAVKRLFPGLEAVRRDTLGILGANSLDGNFVLIATKSLFGDSLQMGETVTLQEILDAEGKKKDIPESD